MQADSYRFDSVDELARVDELRIDEFTLVTNDQKVRLRLSASAAELVAEEPDLTTHGMVGAIVAICKKNRRLSHRPFLFAGVFGGLLMLLLGAAFLDESPPRALTAVPFVGLGLMLASFGLSFRPPQRMALLSTRTHDEAPTWLSRNKDGLVTNVVVSAIFFALGVVVGKL